MNATAVLGDNLEVMSLGQLAQQPVKQWSAICQQFLDRQRREILATTPAPEKLREHRQALRLMLSFAKALYLTAADPEYPDKWVADELHGRLLQLQHSWRMIHEPMPEAEAVALLKATFPTEADQRFISSLLSA